MQIKPRNFRKLWHFGTIRGVHHFSCHSTCVTQSQMRRTDQDWESQCTRCGASCHFAVVVNGLPVVVDDLHCKFLEFDPDGRTRCSVYSERFERAPWCQHASEAVEQGLLAQGCAYTQKRAGYRGKTRLHRRLMDRARPTILAHILEVGVPIGASVDGLRRYLRREGLEDARFEPSACGTRLLVVTER